MSFTKLTIKSEYRSLSDNIVKDFYLPVLDQSILYKRAVGFFSSTALVEISKGISGLIKNGGMIQLIASPHLSDEDIEAINKGYELRNNVIERALLNAISEPQNYYEEERLNILANLIAQEKLEIKIAFTKVNNGIGIYHEKLGLVYDKEGNIICFTGSINESSMAFLNNYEVFDVYCSWQSEFERNKVIEKEDAFGRLWGNEEENVFVAEFPQVALDKLKSYKKGTVNLNIDQEELDDFLGDKFRDKNVSYSVQSIKVPALPASLKLHQYQQNAIENWQINGFRGIFDMATGTGKTYTGLAAIVKLSEYLQHKFAVIIVCPYQHLVEQWVEDIIKFNINPIIGYSGSSQKDWKNCLENAIRDQKLKVKGREFFCFICTNATFSSDFVQTCISKIKGDALLVIDEAHNFGSSRLSTMLSNSFNYRLALSATLERYRDEEGTAKLLNYFGKKCIEYTLERAIEEKKLTPYKYYPVIVNLNERELEVYSYLSQEISKCVIQDKNGKKRLSEKGERLALKRARLVAAAEGKISKLKEVILPYLNQSHILVYCGAASILSDNDDFLMINEDEIRQIDAVTHLLGNELNMKVSQFTSKEGIEEREILKREFAKGENLQALIAIKCLDEGVNIPNIKAAFILASTTNPKEYIQRRGRVLRLAPGKEYAEIYDFITVPRPLDEVSSLTVAEINKDLSLIRNELNRAEEFARLAMNAMQADVIIQEIKEVYGLQEKYTEFTIV
ncbi:MAG TPA: DEAD/DEAH box helicase family protein [Acetivibrio sp.]|nr:DEAD/DEAH box helicase family protein [Acetivibrio sp.]